MITDYKVFFKNLDFGIQKFWILTLEKFKPERQVHQPSIKPSRSFSFEEDKTKC